MNLPKTFGRYLLMEKLATGGMAEIFKAKLLGVEGFEKTVVIKRILPFWSERPDFVSMLVDEAKVLVHLNHPNIVQVYELGRFQETYFIAMEYVEGFDLRKLVQQGASGTRAIPLGVSGTIILHALRGLQYAHRRSLPEKGFLGVVHRDISPQNILLSLEGEVKVTDFGIAKAVTQTHETQTGVLKGKYAYMSPEQAMGRVLDARSDLYSCGIVLFELLCHQRLFSGKNDMETLDLARKAAIPWSNPNFELLPPPLQNFLRKSLALRPEDRFASAEAMGQALEACLGSEFLQTPRQLAAYFREIHREDIQPKQGEGQSVTDRAVGQPRQTLISPSGIDETVSLVSGKTIPRAGQQGSALKEASNKPWVQRAKKLPVILGILWLGIAIALAYYYREYLNRMPPASTGNPSPMAVPQPGPERRVQVSPEPTAPTPLPSPEGSLWVQSNPPEADLRVRYSQEERSGKGSLQLNHLPLDIPMNITARLEGYETQSKIIKISSADPNVTQIFQLKKVPPKLGSLSVNAVPWGRVHLSGYIQGRETPVRKGNIPEGRYRVRVNNPALNKTAQSTVVIRGGRTTRCHVDFEKRPTLRCR